MLLKPYKTSDYKIALESLLKRLNPGHEKAFKIEEELSLQEAGENGEKHLLTILTENQLPKNTYILHNISIKSIITIQIDIILISPSWCLILEVKNLNGELTFTNNPPQLICVKEDKKLSYRSPEAQIDQYILALTTFLEQHQIKVPIYGAIVLPYNNAIIDKPPSKYPLFMGRGIIQYIWSLPKKEVIPSKQVGELLIQYSKERIWDHFPLTQYYSINPQEIRTGVECPNCGTIPMKRLKRTWHCEKCNTRSMYAHEKALRDYYMLINKTISPSEAMNYLRLRNRFEATRILKANSKSRTGNTTACKYELSING